MTSDEHEKEAKRHSDRAAEYKGNDPVKYKNHQAAQKAHEAAAATPSKTATRKAVSASEYVDPHGSM